MAHDPALRRHIDSRLNVLKRQRQSWEPGWRELSRFVNPRRGLFFTSPNQGGRGAQANGAILDPTALFALRTLVAGLMSGVTSPARPWFRLSIPERRVASLASVKVWLDECAERMRMVFNASNLYSALPSIYEELGQFGTGCAIVEFDREDVIRLCTLSTGEYWLGLDWRGRVDTLARRFMYSYRQIQERWPDHGIAEIAERARGADADTEIALLHMIEPNTGFEKGRLDQAGKKFRSVYWREGGGQAEGEFIHRGGYSQFPALTPRWAPIGNDAYGHTRGVRRGDTCTEAQATDWLREDLQAAEGAVRRLVDVPLTQGQFDALVSFVFNIGPAAFGNSTLLRLLNAADAAGAAGQFKRWNRGADGVLPGLVTRRAAERDLFLSQEA